MRYVKIFVLGLLFSWIFLAWIDILTRPVVANTPKLYEMEEIPRKVEQAERTERTIYKATSLEQMGGEFFTEWARPHQDVIEKVLKERGYMEDSDFVQLMLYVGEHESHWRPEANNNNIYFGVFQMSKHIFSYWNPTGSILELEDQIHAFVTMHENKRTHCGQFETLCEKRCNWEPCLGYWVDRSFVRHDLTGVK